MDDDLDLVTPPKSPKPHEILWFPRGDVVLSTDTYLFKVHTDILSLQSSVFKDMFDFPAVDGDEPINVENQAGIAPDRYEGLPLVKLSGDKGEDMVHLLRAVYERQYYRHESNDTPLDTVTALLLLSTKYDFKQIRRDVIMQISRQYPMTLDEFEAIDDDDDDHLPLLKALATANVDALLPLLYYAASHQGLAYLFAAAEDLGPERFSTLIQGRSQMKDAINDLIGDIPDDLHDLKADFCPVCARTARASNLKSLLGEPDLYFCRGERLVKSCVEGICERCSPVLSTRLESNRRRIWEDVPSFFGFQTWEILQEKLEDTISS